MPSTYIKNIQGPSVQLEQLIQLRHHATNISHGRAPASQKNISGNHRSIFRGKGMDFDEVRIYQPGDDIRSIDWRVTARTAKTHTKIFREEKECPVLLAIDQRPCMFFGTQKTYKSVIAAELASILAWSTLYQQDKIGGIVFNHHRHSEIKPKRSKQSLLSLLKIISDFNQELLTDKIESNKFSLQSLLEKIRFLAKPGSKIYIISDFFEYNAEAERLLYIIKRHTDIKALIISDNMERNLPSHSELNVTNGNQKRFINTKNINFVAKYQQAYDDNQKLLRSSFNKLGIPCQRIWTHDDPFLSLSLFSQKKEPHKIIFHQQTNEI